MAEATVPANKAELLAIIQDGFKQFEALLASLPEEQMTIPGVNGSWSVKDNLAHLAAWQNYQAARMQSALDGTEPPDPAPGRETEDDVNEYFYERDRQLPLVEVLAEFRASYQRVLAVTQAMSWEMLNGPFPWYDNNAPIGAYTLGNTTGHYELHGGLIQMWLVESQT
ncbi:MAG TPA: ClbS/DfsB family four-helix bundle protein [Ktedonobacteraceae bacterium]|nr:ClbS/DfsB family four-helix bundle protein [Ktedonobacteraceae bacterium]